MAKPRVVGIDLVRHLILIHYIDDDDKIIDEKIAAIRWRTNPALKRLVQAFAEVVSHYALGENKSLEKLEGEDLTRLFKDLLDDEKNQ